MLLAMAFVIAACGGGGGGGGGNAQAGSDTPTSAPTLSFSSSSTAVDAGGSVTLSWSSSNADSCVASGGWVGNKATSGSETVGPLQNGQTFAMSCSGSGGGTLRELSVTVNQRGGVQVSLNSDRQYVSVNGQVQLSWSASNADNCEASGDWQGAQSLSGVYTTPPLTENASFKLTCFAQGESAIALVSVQVASATVSWQAPTENVDGTPLVDLAGFKIYWGDSPRSYVDSHALNSPTATQWDMSSVGSGIYYVAVTAIDADADESSYSNEVIKVVP